MAGAAHLARGPGLLAHRRRAWRWRCCSGPASLSLAGRGRALGLARGRSHLPPALPVHQPVPAVLPRICWRISGASSGSARWFGWYGEATFGRIVLLLLFNEIVIVGGGWLMDGRWSRSWRLRGPAAARRRLFASLTPQIARFGSGEAVAALPRHRPDPGPAGHRRRGPGRPLGADLPAYRRRARRDPRPAAHLRGAASAHWREGAAKGAIYSFVFMLLVHLAGAVPDAALAWPLVSTAPALAAIVAGTLLYPLARTIIESFDGSAPFFRPPARQLGRADRLCPRAWSVGTRHRPRDPAGRDLPRPGVPLRFRRRGRRRGLCRHRPAARRLGDPGRPAAAPAELAGLRAGGVLWAASPAALSPGTSTRRRSP